MLRFFSFLVFLSVLFPLSARADYTRWQDPDSGLTLSFPDTWKAASSSDADAVITLIGPSDADYPKCVVKVRDDKRYVIFPARYGRTVQTEALSKRFWDSYLGEYEAYDLQGVREDVGLGRWNATMALAGYTGNDGTMLERRQAVLFASLYFDKLYIVECSALAGSYESWHFPFLGIIKSVDFKKTYNETLTGHYRDFITKAEKYFWSQTNDPDAITRY